MIFNGLGEGYVVRRKNQFHVNSLGLVGKKIQQKSWGMFGYAGFEGGRKSV
jgi:hypothetical protein